MTGTIKNQGAGVIHQIKNQPRRLHRRRSAGQVEWLILALTIRAVGSSSVGSSDERPQLRNLG